MVRFVHEKAEEKKKAPVFKSPKILGWTSAIYRALFDLAGGDAQIFPG